MQRLSQTLILREETDSTSYEDHGPIGDDVNILHPGVLFLLSPHRVPNRPQKFIIRRSLTHLVPQRYLLGVKQANLKPDVPREIARDSENIGW